MINLSVFLNYLAKKKGRVFIPKWLYGFYSLPFCDVCGGRGNLLVKVDHLVEYKWFRPCWASKASLGYVYKHAHYSDCKKNKEADKQLDTILQAKPTRRKLSQQLRRWVEKFEIPWNRGVRQTFIENYYKYYCTT